MHESLRLHKVGNTPPDGQSVLNGPGGGRARTYQRSLCGFSIV